MPPEKIKKRYYCREATDAGQWPASRRVSRYLELNREIDAHLTIKFNMILSQFYENKQFVIMPPNKKNQHYIPKSYFKLFTNGEDRIFVYNLNRQAVESSVNHLCCGDYFYSKDPSVDTICN